jgi:SAM-dependent methyltransferase
MLQKLLRNNRQRINQDLPDIDQRKYFSPALYALTKKILQALEEHAHGQLIDIGCGDMPFKYHLPKAVTQYDTLDIEARTEGVTYIGSVLDMYMIKDESYDSAMCFDVLEHVPNPFEAVQEICRVLKKGGILMLSVPHLSRLHEIPHDYYRYTEFGIRSMLESNGFEIIEIDSTGSLCCFLGHQVSSILNCLFWRIPIFKWIIFYLNKCICVLPCFFIDRYFLKARLFPLGYICIAQKR